MLIYICLGRGMALLSALFFCNLCAASPLESRGAPGEELTQGINVLHVTTGIGRLPSATDTVNVAYRGTFLDGTEFDKSTAPVIISLEQVIPCWTEALQKVRVGGTARIFCPAETAYRMRGVPGIIPPNSPLLFELKLLSITGRAAPSSINFSRE
ncbi:MAG: FKBP-type peptidyl-prolyl cis-trans isomerase [Agitococcus sp.]|nr:FKBP-type peptidyl-prolyl cis-trans isomerase [Agitococcus sp.]